MHIFSNTRRGNTQKSRHSRMVLSGISTLKKQSGADPRLQASGMTGNFNTPLIRTSSTFSLQGRRGSSPLEGEDARRAGEGVRGFTLIELLVVILIVAILAAIAVPQFQLAIDKATFKAHFPVIRAIINAENLYKLEHGDYTYNWNELGLNISQQAVSGSGINMVLKDGGTYKLENYAGIPHVYFKPRGHETRGFIYADFETNRWLCYPNGTARGKRLCRSLGCSETSVEKLYCEMQPAR